MQESHFKKHSSLYEAVVSNKSPYLVAEIGLNHNGDFELAMKTLEAACKSGANAVKFQTIDARKLVAPAPEKHGGDLNDPISFFDSFRLEVSQYNKLKERAHELGMHFFSTPFDEDAADMLEKIGVDAFKISSGDITHIPLIKHLSKKDAPLIISTGMSTMEEVSTAVNTAKQSGCSRIILLHCSFCHPSKDEDLNLLSLSSMIKKFQLPSGLSDHTPDNIGAVIATVLGARMIEKHFTLDRNLPGPDQTYSLDPEGFADLRHQCDLVPVILGSEEKLPMESEKSLRILARRSIHAARNISKNSVIKSDDLIIVRPAEGLPPADISSTIGRKAVRDIRQGCPVKADDLD